MKRRDIVLDLEYLMDWMGDAPMVDEAAGREVAAIADRAKQEIEKLRRRLNDALDSRAVD